MTNQHVAQRLQQYARDLQERHDNLYRIRSCRRAAESILRLDAPVKKIVDEEGTSGLTGLPGIGRSLAATISHYIATGEWLSREELAARG